MISLLLALLLQGMPDADYAAARERENPSAEQAQAVVTEAISREDFGASVILHTNGTKRGECIIEGPLRMTCVRSTRMAPNHFHFDPPLVHEMETGSLDVAGIVAGEREYVGLPPLE